MEYNSSNTFAAAEALLDKIAETGNAAGFAAAVVNLSGEIVWEKYSGNRDRAQKLPVDGDTIFGLASVTKSFTALSVLTLQESGILNVNDAAADYLPEFRGTVRGKPVLIRHLLSHSGGWYPTERLCVPTVAADLGLDLTKEDAGFSLPLAEEGGRRVAAGLDSQKTYAAPGEQMSYCNDGYGLLSEIVRRYGDCDSYAEYVKKHICDPLGMSRSGADFLRPAADENSAVLYSIEDDGTARADRDYTNRAFVLGGGGAMKSTLNDMTRYLTMLLQKGAPIMSEETFAWLLEPQVEYSPVSHYCFGLIRKELHGRTVWEHSGSLPGVSSAIVICPEAGLASVLLCNTEDVSATAGAEGILSAAMGCDPEPVHAAANGYRWSAERCTSAAGYYAKDEGGELTLTVGVDGIPGLTVDGAEKQISPLSDNVLLIPGKFGDAYLTLIEENGRVTAARYGSRVFEKRT